MGCCLGLAPHHYRNNSVAYCSLDYNAHIRKRMQQYIARETWRLEAGYFDSNGLHVSIVHTQFD